MINPNSAKLYPSDVNAIRALAAARFTTSSIGRAYFVVPRAIRDLIHCRSWRGVPHEVVPLPPLPLDRAGKLVLFAAGKLTDEQRQVVKQYAETLVEQDDAMTRQVYVEALVGLWKPRHTRRKRKDRRDHAAATATEATAAGSIEADRDASASDRAGAGR